MKRLLDLLEGNEKRTSCSQAAGAVSTFTDAQKQAIVDKHNEYRRNEGASNMRELVWNQELADIAQRTAEYDLSIGTLSHVYANDCNGGGLGQNIYYSGTSVRGQVPPVTSAVDSWMEEKPFTQYAPITQSASPNGYCPREGQTDPSFNGGRQGIMCGHYTQVVWAKSYEVGCGMASGQNGGFYDTYIVCNYRPQGNFIGQYYYKQGPACSECPSGTSCSNGLCSTGGGSSGGNSNSGNNNSGNNNTPAAAGGNNNNNNAGGGCAADCKDLTAQAAQYGIDCAAYGQKVSSIQFCRIESNYPFISTFCRGSCSYRIPECAGCPTKRLTETAEKKKLGYTITLEV